MLHKDRLGRNKMAYVLGKEDLEVGADGASDIDGHRHLARTQPHNWLVLLQLDFPDTSLGSICLVLIEVFVKNLASYFGHCSIIGKYVIVLLLLLLLLLL